MKIEMDKRDVFLEGLIFKELFCRKRPVDPYYFHELYKISPAQIALFLETYKDSGFIQLTPYGRMELTKHGIKYILKNRKSLFIQRQIDYSDFTPEKSKEKSHITNYERSISLYQNIKKIRKNQFQ